MQIFILSTVFVTTHDFTKINCMKVNIPSHYSNFLWKYSTYFFDNAHFRYEMSCQRCRHNCRKYLKLWKLERNTFGRFVLMIKLKTVSHFLQVKTRIYWIKFWTCLNMFGKLDDLLHTVAWSSIYFYTGGKIVMK